MAMGSPVKDHHPRQAQYAVIEPTPTVTPQQTARLKAGYIRFVRISPSKCGDVVCCETLVARVSDKMPYKAISYAWGDATPVRPIHVDGCLHMVAENLWQFLRQASDIPERFWCWLWVDALSIDQTNTEERRHQINIMSKIFGEADQVIVWLGPCPVLRTLGVVEMSSSLWHIRDGYRTIARTASVCESPYWRRLWVFQELRSALDVTFMSGDYFAGWNSLANFWTLAKTLLRGFHAESRGIGLEQMFGAEPIARMEAMLQARDTNYQNSDMSLWDLLYRTKDLMCSEPHDRVYGILGLASKGHEDLQADYRIPLHTLANMVLRNKYALESSVANQEIGRKPATNFSSSFKQMTDDVGFLAKIFGNPGWAIQGRCLELKKDVDGNLWAPNTQLAFEHFYLQEPCSDLPGQITSWAIGLTMMMEIPDTIDL